MDAFIANSFIYICTKCVWKTWHSAGAVKLLLLLITDVGGPRKKASHKQGKAMGPGAQNQSPAWE